MNLREMTDKQVSVYRCLAGPLIWKCRGAEASIDVVWRELPTAQPYQAEAIAAILDGLRPRPMADVAFFPGVTKVVAPDDFVDTWTVWEMEVASDQA